MPILCYLHFNGNCREAFEFYRSVFGGEFAMITTFGEGPPDMGVPEAEANNVMHVTLNVGDSVLMGERHAVELRAAPGNRGQLRADLSDEQPGGDGRPVREGIRRWHGDDAGPGHLLGGILRGLHGQVRNQLAVQLRTAPGWLTLRGRC